METIASKTLSKQPICGVEVFTLPTHIDSRGSLTEIFRQNWLPEKEFCQWNLVHSNANTLRGVHVHPKHTDFLLATSGMLTIGLLDLREKSATFNKSQTLSLKSNPIQAILIPNGVAHGFYSKKKSTHIYSVDRYWDPDDELGCHWEETKEFINWPLNNPLLSKRDQNAQPLESLRHQLKRYLSNQNL